MNKKFTIHSQVAVEISIHHMSMILSAQHDADSGIINHFLFKSQPTVEQAQKMFDDTWKTISKQTGNQLVDQGFLPKSYNDDSVDAAQFGADCEEHGIPNIDAKFMFQAPCAIFMFIILSVSQMTDHPCYGEIMDEWAIIARRLHDLLVPADDSPLGYTLN